MTSSMVRSEADRPDVEERMVSKLAFIQVPSSVVMASYPYPQKLPGDNRVLTSSRISTLLHQGSLGDLGPVQLRMRCSANNRRSLVLIETDIGSGSRLGWMML